jgi:hypothetical protein
MTGAPREPICRRSRLAGCRMRCRSVMLLRPWRCPRKDETLGKLESSLTSSTIILPNSSCAAPTNCLFAGLVSRELPPLRTAHLSLPSRMRETDQQASLIWVPFSIVLHSLQRLTPLRLFVLLSNNTSSVGVEEWFTTCPPTSPESGRLQRVDRTATFERNDRKVRAGRFGWERSGARKLKHRDIAVRQERKGAVL